MSSEIVSVLSDAEIDRIDALAAQRGLTRDGMIAELIRGGLLREEARRPRAPEPGDPGAGGR